MRVAVVHYHLRRGGVTRVIEHAARALEHTARLCVIAGGPPQESSPLSGQTRVLDALAYSADTAGTTAPRELARDMMDTARDALGGMPDLWHVHNHSLGKNPAFCEALRHLVECGCPVLLQIHDFAEDMRPALYRALLSNVGRGSENTLGEVLYPVVPHVHYAALTRRDHTFLLSSGIPGDRLHLLPNAVEFPPDTPNADPSPHIDSPQQYLYPTRAIRRKNLGEVLLWAALESRGRRYGITLAPENPAEQSRYRRWVDLAHTLALPVDFEVGPQRNLPLPALLRSSLAAVTASVAEGFGLAFLEPWTVDRPVLGRNLPEITEDFASAGIDLSMLYTRLPVPLAWLSAGVHRTRLAATMRSALEAYGRPPSEAGLQKAYDSAVQGDTVDFGHLDVDLQEGVIRRAAASAAAASELFPPAFSLEPCAPEITAANRDAVLREFSLEAYGRRLLDTYQRVAASEPGPVEGAGSVAALLNAFLAPERFRPIRI